MLWSIIVGGFIGFLARAITNKGGAMGVIANVVAVVSFFFGKKG